MLKKKLIQSKRLIKESNPFIIRSGRLKDAKLQKVNRSGWAEDVFVSDSGEKETIGKKFNYSKLSILSLIIFLCLGILFARMAWLQVARGEYYYEIAEGNRIRIKRIEPKRGVIYDRNGLALVQNRPNFILYIVPADLPDKKEKQDLIINSIYNILGQEVRDRILELLDQINLNSLEAYNPLFVTDNIEREKAMELYLKAPQWPGVLLSSGSQRDYLFTGSALESETGDNNKYQFFSLAHILGYTGKVNKAELETLGPDYQYVDYVGKMGIEYFWESELRGVGGKKQIEVDALGKEKKVLREEAPTDGHNLLLSLDVEAQLKLEEILLKKISALKLAKACGIVLDPANGEIIAMVSLPSFDNNLFARGISQHDYNKLIMHPDKPLFNRAISGEYPSGSTIKPIMAISALEEGIITEYTTFNSVGGISVGKWFFPDWRSGGHGRTNVRKAIADSVNTFFYYIGGGYDNFNGLGLERITSYFEKFGLGNQLGIDLAGESSGFLPSREWKKEKKGESWYIGDTYHLSIGQGDILATPLQVANFTAVFANGGKLFRPHLIRQILDKDDRLLKNVEQEPVNENFLDNYNIRIVREGMRQTILSGSARSLQSVGVEVAGKTGTAQWSSQKNNHAWFTGFAPYDEAKLVITILVEEGGEGSQVAVPIAGEFLDWYFGEHKKE